MKFFVKSSQEDQGKDNCSTKETFVADAIASIDDCNKIQDVDECQHILYPFKVY